MELLHQLINITLISTSPLMLVLLLSQLDLTRQAFADGVGEGVEFVEDLIQFLVKLLSPPKPPLHLNSLKQFFHINRFVFIRVHSWFLYLRVRFLTTDGHRFTQMEFVMVVFRKLCLIPITQKSVSICVYLCSSVVPFFLLSFFACFSSDEMVFR